MKVDVLAIGAHPDDVEFTSAGTILKLVAQGKKVAIVDCTEGEMGSRGTVEIRRKEAEKAAELLGIVERKNLGLPDSFLQDNPDFVLEIVKVLRYFRPEIVLFPPPFERHPDHEVTHTIVRKALFLSGLVNLQTTYQEQKQKPWKVQWAFSYMQAYQIQPDFYVDISDVFEKKMEVVKAYQSQVYNPQADHQYGPMTFISSPHFLEMLESRARYFGTLIGVKYAEAFTSLTPVGLPSLSVFLETRKVVV